MVEFCVCPELLVFDHHFFFFGFHLLFLVCQLLFFVSMDLQDIPDSPASPDLPFNYDPSVDLLRNPRPEDENGVSSSSDMYSGFSPGVQFGSLYDPQTPPLEMIRGLVGICNWLPSDI